MSSPAQDITIRRASLEDKDAVMSLGDQYGGRDYLFAIYSDLLQNSDTYAVVAMVEDKVVGFYMTTTFDGGVTVMKRAARVAEGYRGRGILHLMEEELERHTMQHRPQVLYETIANTDRQDRLIDRFTSKGYTSVYRRGLLNRLLQFSHGYASETGVHDRLVEPVEGVHKMSREDLGVLFQAETSQPRVFPERRLFNFYLGYRLHSENIPSILCKNGGAFFSFIETNLNKADQPQKDPKQNLDLDQTQQPNKSCINQSNDQSSRTNTIHNASEEFSSGLNPSNTRNVAMVTFYFCFPTRSGFLYFLDIYATPEVPVSPDHLQIHLRRHLEAAKHHFPDRNGILTVAFDRHLSKDLISSGFTELGVRDELPGQEDFQVLYERHINKQ